MMIQKKCSLFRNCFWEFRLKNRRQHFPESVTRVTIEKQLFPGFNGRKRPQNKNFGFRIENRIKRVLYFHRFSLAPFGKIFAAASSDENLACMACLIDTTRYICYNIPK